VAPGATTTTTTQAGAVVASVQAPHPAAATSSTGAVAAAWPIDGAWAIGAGTQARYGIDDTAMGQTSRVVGTTQQVTGTMQIVGTAVTATRAVVNMASVTCHCVHDMKYRQMLDVAKYPTSMFVLTDPISLAALPAQGAVITVPVTGNFTIHGVTRSVTFNVQATRLGSRIGVKGTIPVKLSDYNISAPNAGSFGGLSNCDIELLLGFDPA
jgi:polyisoprenoid-binding protein YceI